MISGSLIHFWHQYYVKHVPSHPLLQPLGEHRPAEAGLRDGTLAVCRSAAEQQGEVVLPCSSLRIMD